MEYTSKAEPRTKTDDGIPIFCRYDECVSLELLKPNPSNPNMHGSHQLELLGEIICATGWRAPITVSKQSGYIVKGHGRLKAALLRGLTQAPVEYQDYTSYDEELADLLADNRIAELSVLDPDELANVIAAIDAEKIPLELTGYTYEDIATILKIDEEEVIPDGKTDVNKGARDPKSKPDDLWILGENRLLCASATEFESVKKLMNGEKAQMVHIDVPNVDDLATVLYPALENIDRFTKDDAAFYIWRPDRQSQIVESAKGLRLRQNIIWVKDSYSVGYSDYHCGHEICSYMQHDGMIARFFGGTEETSVWNVALREENGVSMALQGGVILTDGNQKLYLSGTIPKGKRIKTISIKKGANARFMVDDKGSDVWNVSTESKVLCPSQKPIGVALRAIQNSSDVGDVVIDCFSGSGTTLMAASLLGRHCMAMDNDPKMIDMTVNRYVEQYGPSEVGLERDGQVFSYWDIFEEG